jgi:NAD(P)H dehydrogenase (quinone)
VKAFIVYAHPEPKSFNAALKDRAKAVFEAAGHDVMVSDLYSMNFRPTIDRRDFLSPANPDMLQIPLEQEHAHKTRTTADDIAAEQEKLLWADFVLFQSPLWLYSQPAILKGWMERVFSSGFAHEVKADVAGRRWFENGGLKGRRAMLSLTCAGSDAAFAPLGRHGDMERILWPIHNALRYSGLDVMPPHIAYAVLRGGDEHRQGILKNFDRHLEQAWTAAPLPFHSLDEYDDHHQLAAGVVPRTAGQWQG